MRVCLSPLLKRAAVTRTGLLVAACTAAAVVAQLVCPPPLSAAEPHLEFIRGLRARGYHDVALDYLAELSMRSDVPADVRQVLPYERALTLLDGAGQLTSAKARREQLDAAQAAFEQFVQSAGDHPLVGEANSQRAKILLEKAQVELWDADDPANAQSRAAFQARARQLIVQSREVSQQALVQREAAFRAFPLSIPEDDRERRRQREQAELKYLQTLLDLAESTYWEAQSYDPGSSERNRLLEQAIAGFGEIHARYRSQIVGLLSRLWQGKSFEEMGLIGEALGIYNTFLTHEGTSESMLELKARAQWFRLICLNHESRKDYRVVIQEATEWRNNAGRRALGEPGLGILYEMARAQEALGTDRSLPDAERANYLAQALASARQVARFPGRFKAPALGLVRRVAAAMGRPEQDPRNFNDAFGIGSQYAEQAGKQLREYERLLTEGRDEEALAVRTALTASASEMTRLFELALRLVTDDTDPQNLAIARLQLATGYFMQQKYYESAAAAEYTTQHLPVEYDELARLAAFTRMAAYQNAYNDLAGEDREFERRQTIASAEDIVARWPDSSEATDARDTIAKIYVNEGDKAQAADWWAQVPPTADDYAGSQIKAGQAYWSAYGEQTSLPDAERVALEELQRLRDAAEQHLVTGISAWQSQLPQDAATPQELVLGKLTLAQIRNLNGVYKTAGDVPGALELLTQPPHAVLAAVAVPPGEARPTDPTKVRSARIAGFAYQQLLRAHIGLRNLEAAAEARAQLEAAAAGEDSAALTQVYIAFGQELQKELEQLHDTGQHDRLREVRAGFEEFLDSVSQREQGQTFGSLLWIAETYTSLAEGSRDVPGESEPYFQKASATYDRMMARAQSDAAFLANPEQKTVIALRLADCRKRQGNFPAAEQALFDAVQLSPTAPNVQFEAALLYRDWGAAETGAADKFLTALNGRSDPPLWGWNQLARRLQQALLVGQRDERVEQMHIDTRYYQAECYRLYALQQPEDEQVQHLNLAKFGIEAFARIAGSLPPEDFARFDRLYQQIRDDLGEERLTLDAAIARTSTAPRGPEPAAAAPSTAHTARDAPAAGPAARPTRRSNFAVVLLLIGLGIAGCIGLYVMAVRQERRKRQLRRRSPRSTGTA